MRVASVSKQGLLETRRLQTSLRIAEPLCRARDPYPTVTQPSDAERQISTSDFPGPTRECFIETLLSCSARQQADALEAILEEYPLSDVSAEDDPKFRTPQFMEQIRGWILRLRAGADVVAVMFEAPSDVVRRALSDADALISVSGPVSAVDRLHTAMHGYLKEMCAQANIDVASDATINKLLKELRAGHPRLQNMGARGDDVARVLQGMGTVLDALNPLRNNASVAHPNAELIGEDEAHLVVNAVRTILNYLESKLRPALNPEQQVTAPAIETDEEPF